MSDKMRDLDRATVQAKADREVFQKHVSALAAQVIREAAERGELPVSPDDVHWGEPPGLVSVTGSWYRIDSLDAAWAEAEAALPEFGGRVEYVQWESPGYRAAASWISEWHYGTGPTPAAALRALAAKLREREA